MKTLADILPGVWNGRRSYSQQYHFLEDCWGKPSIVIREDAHLRDAVAYFAKDCPDGDITEIPDRFWQHANMIGALQKLLLDLIKDNE